jgi:hypothetical protein
MPHADTFDEFDVDQQAETSGMYGEYEYLTHMAEKAYTGAPQQVFWGMAENESGDFDQELHNFASTQATVLDPTEADFNQDLADDEDQVDDWAEWDYELPPEYDFEVEDILNGVDPDELFNQASDQLDDPDIYFDAPVQPVLGFPVGPQGLQGPTGDTLPLDGDIPPGYDEWAEYSYEDPGIYFDTTVPGEDGDGGTPGLTGETPGVEASGDGTGVDGTGVDGTGVDGTGGDGTGEEVMKSIFDALDATEGDIDQILALVDGVKAGGGTLSESDIQAWANSPRWKGNEELQNDLRNAGLLPKVATPSAITQARAEGEPPERGEYDTATENLRARFFTTIYKQEGAGQASSYELDDLLAQTQLLFFLEKGGTAWQNIVNVEKDASALEQNYQTYLDEYLDRPFSQRLDPASGPDFYTLVKDVSRIFKKSEESPDIGGEHEALWDKKDSYGVADKDKKLWVDGLFGEEVAGSEARRDTLVKLGLTHGGMGYYSKMIHTAAQNQMDYYRDVGWSEGKIFDHMTKGLSKPQAAQQLAGASDLAKYDEWAEPEYGDNV